MVGLRLFGEAIPCPIAQGGKFAACATGILDSYDNDASRYSISLYPPRRGRRTADGQRDVNRVPFPIYRSGDATRPNLHRLAPGRIFPCGRRRGEQLSIVWHGDITPAREVDPERRSSSSFDTAFLPRNPCKNHPLTCASGKETSLLSVRFMFSTIYAQDLCITMLQFLLPYHS